MSSYIEIDKTSSQPLYRQVRFGLEKAILQGLFADRKLPSTRDLAESIGVSRNTVVTAFEELIAEGLIQSNPKSGRLVNPELEQFRGGRGKAPPSDSKAGWIETLTYRRSAVEMLHLNRSSDWRECRFPFVTAALPHEVFPTAAWLRASKQAFEAEHRWFSLQDNVGEDDPLLVDILCGRMLPERGLEVRPENILITAGSQHALHLLAQLLVDEGDCVAVEDPGYADARHTFFRAGARLLPVPVDGAGIEVEKIPPSAKVVMVTPSHQLPTNSSMSGPRRRRLLDLARERQFCVVEDDYDSEMRFVGHAVPPLASHGLEHVIYVSSFSKTMGAAVRIGFIVADAEIIAKLRDIRRYMVRNVAGHQQRALGIFIRDGHYGRLVRSLRSTARRRWEGCKALVSDILPEWQVNATHGGMNLWLTGPPRIDTRVLAERLRKRSVAIEPGAVFFSQPDQGRSTVKLGFAVIRDADVPRGLGIIADECRRF